MTGQQLRRRLADLADAERVDEAVERDRAAPVDRLQELARRHFAPALARADLGVALMEAEDVRRRLDQTVAPEGEDVLLAEPVDIEGKARAEMDEALDRLCRADEAAGAAPRGFARLADGEAAADRALRLRRPRRRQLRTHRKGRRRGPSLGHHRDDLRDDVAGALDDDGVAVAEVLARDLVLVMQRRARDDDAADIDRLEIGPGGEDTGTPDGDLDRFQHRHSLLGGKFVGQRPARRPAHHAEPRLPIEAVDLVDDAVDVVGELCTLLADLAVKGEGGLDRRTKARLRIDRETPLAQALEEVPMRRRHFLADLAQGIAEEPQRPLRRHGRIELAQRAGGKIARIGEKRLAAGGTRLVEAKELRLLDIDFAAHFEDVGGGAAQRLRKRADRPQILGHVLALRAVAPRGAAPE